MLLNAAARRASGKNVERYNEKFPHDHTRERRRSLRGSPAAGHHRRLTLLDMHHQFLFLSFLSFVCARAVFVLPCVCFPFYFFIFSLLLSYIHSFLTIIIYLAAFNRARANFFLFVYIRALFCRVIVVCPCAIQSNFERAQK